MILGVYGKKKVKVPRGSEISAGSLGDILLGKSRTTKWRWVDVKVLGSRMLMTCRILIFLTVIMSHQCLTTVREDNTKLTFLCWLMAAQNIDKPESLAIWITVTLMVKDKLTGNRDAEIILDVAHLIFHPIVAMYQSTHSCTSLNFS